jgi:hypothetical protein
MDEFYQTLVKEYTENKSKPTLINMMIDYCNTATNKDVYNLKVKLETEFSTDVKCTYCYTMQTPQDYGCDLREIFYNRTGDLIERGQELLDIFKTKKVNNIWHIMTDIDDTLYPHTAYGIAGADYSAPSKKPYPRIKQFYNTLYSKLPVESQYSTVLSATPGCIKSFKIKSTEHELHSILQKYGFIQGDLEDNQAIVQNSLQFGWNIGNHLLKPITNRFLSDTNLPITPQTTLFTQFGITKFNRYKQYVSLFPEHDIIFIGDNGQGDVIAGKKMLTYAESNNLICIVCIHQIAPDGVHYIEPTEEDKSIKNLNFFKTYQDLGQILKTKYNIFNHADLEQIEQDIQEQELKLSQDQNQQKEQQQDKEVSAFGTIGGNKQNKKRTNKKRTNKKRTNKKRTNKKRTNKKRTNKRKFNKKRK